MSLRIRTAIPNALTLGNLACGVLALWLFARDHTQAGILLILAAALLDVFDGAVARWLKAQSPVGKDLDSLADLVSFGVAPATLLAFSMPSPPNAWQAFLLLLLPMSSALRLARFNHDARQTNAFIGVPTPFSGLYLLLVVWSEPFWLFSPLNTQWGYPLLALLAAFWLHAPIRLFSFKSLSKSPKAMRWRISFLALISLLCLSLGWLGALAILPAYLLFSMIENRWP